MNTLSLVTGANGHLGNTLVRALLARGQQVRAGVRDPDRSAALNGLDCQVVCAELQDPDSLQALNTLCPGYRLPRRAPKALLLLIARLQEQRARYTGQPAELLLSQVQMFYGVRQVYCIDKAINELGYQSRSPQNALKQAFTHLLAR
ncbi:NAD(P)H-binding protein [Pseudomonas sp. UW4]|jgi:NAD(P)-dependent dehydrogenase (short-subunit alcohol dehydrogenase family)|uniref:NAD(P)H-binding protein n=1 Tax=Pseudomonas sp. UW4 TaxID=1207075 RepID=UPI00029CEB93|nr:NAD(P)H-binding protein [Pseudomonas sp. UW4]AFY20552.1 hypothetical protein PputUW4_03358 [Pseudomonas sp. UW4]